MTDEEMLTSVKSALGIQGEYLDDTISEYITEVVGYLVDAGIPRANIPAGIVARGVSDLWNYGSGEGELSTYFMQRATQLSYKR